MQNVNFLSKLNLSLFQQQEKDKQIFKYAAIVFGVITLCFVLILGSSFYLQYKINNTQQLIDAVSDDIDANRQLEADYLFFVNKLIIIKNLFDQRADKQIAVSYFEDLFPDQIRISGLTYNMEDGELSLTVTSPHVFYLEDALEVVEDPAVEEKFESLAKTNLTRASNGEYSFNLTVLFSDESELVTVTKEY